MVSRGFDPCVCLDDFNVDGLLAAELSLVFAYQRRNV